MRTHKIPSGRYTLQVYEVGNPDGFPVILLHGGPGAESDLNKANVFDLSMYRVFLADQRGAGKSDPVVATETSRDALRDNTTVELLEDIHLIKQHLGVTGRWIVAGNSFGSTLALLYSVRYPDDVAGLLLWSIFLCRDDDLDGMFEPKGRAAMLFSSEYQDFVDHVDDSEKPVEVYARRFWSQDRVVREDAAWEWVRWNRRLYYSKSRPEPERTEQELTKTVTFARLVQHYFTNRMFLPDLFGSSHGNNQILEQVGNLPDVPIRLVHGEADVCTPLNGAVALAESLQQKGSLTVVPGAGHSTSEPGYLDALQLEALYLNNFSR